MRQGPRRGASDREEPGYSAFQTQHRNFSNRVERVLMQLVILGVVLLAVVQSLQVFPAFRRTANVVEGLEGVPWNEVSSWFPGGTLTQLGAQTVTATGGQTASPVTVKVTLSNQRSAPRVRLLVDGQAAGTFTGAELTVTVRPGQRLVVDGSGDARALTFVVSAAPGAASPALGKTVTTRASQQLLGIVEPARR